MLVPRRVTSLVWLLFLKGKFDLTDFNKNNFETERCYLLFLQIYNLEAINAKGTTVVCEKLLKAELGFFFQRILCTYAVTILKHHFGEFSMTRFVRFGLLV